MFNDAEKDFDEQLDSMFAADADEPSEDGEEDEDAEDEEFDEDDADEEADDDAEDDEEELTDASKD